jgi:hypothetical protein
MSSDPSPLASPSSAMPKPRSGKRGCLIALAIFAIMAVLGLAGLCLLCVAVVNAYTAAAPATVPALSPTSEDLRSAESALKTLRDATVRNKATQIGLTERDLNTIIARDPGLRGMRGRVYLQINSSTISVETAIPLRPTHLPGLSERWLNLVVSFLLTYENDEFSIDFQSATANGQQLPEVFLRNFDRTFSRSMNDKFHEGLKGDLTAAGFWLQIKSIRVEGNKVIVTTKGSL